MTNMQTDKACLTDTPRLKAHMTLKNVSTKDLADAQGWSMSTAYRKINGENAFTVPEVQLCKELLGLDADTAFAIFFKQ